MIWYIFYICTVSWFPYFVNLLTIFQRAVFALLPHAPYLDKPCCHEFQRRSIPLQIHALSVPESGFYINNCIPDPCLKIPIFDPIFLNHIERLPYFTLFYLLCFTFFCLTSFYFNFYFGFFILSPTNQ